jgi:hypothetical protein
MAAPMGGMPTGLSLQSAAWSLAPTWREAAVEERGLPPIVGLPFVTERF